LNGIGIKAGLAALAALAASGACNGTPRPRGPETLGGIPSDLPLPPGFALRGGEESWIRGEGDEAAAHIALEGQSTVDAVAEYFRGHMLLARWKPGSPAAGPGKMLFTKGPRSARVALGRSGELTTVVVDLECGKAEEKP